MSVTTIPTAGIADGAGDTAQLADDAVTAAKATGFGKIAQVVTAQPVTSNFATSSSSYVDVTNLNASITPSATTSKILVHCYVQLYTAGSVQGPVARMQLVRGSTAINGFQASTYDQGGNGVQTNNTATISVLDSPSSSSSVTYKVQLKNTAGSSATVQAEATDGGGGQSTPTFVLMEVLA